MPNRSYDRRSDAALRLLIVIVCCFIAGLVLPLRCCGQEAGITPRHGPVSAADGTTVSPRLLAVPVAAVWGASVYALGATREWHHEYIGAALLVSNKRWVQWVGLAVMVDDAAQHLIQTRHPSYRSPLHQAYAVTLYRWTR